MYAFVATDTRELPGFDDQSFALDLLEQKHVLIAPGVSFNVPYRTHFRVTNLPQPDVLRQVFARMEELPERVLAAGAPADAAATSSMRNHGSSNFLDIVLVSDSFD